jgi:hypothetical protein
VESFYKPPTSLVILYCQFYLACAFSFSFIRLRCHSFCCRMNRQYFLIWLLEVIVYISNRAIQNSRSSGVIGNYLSDFLCGLFVLTIQKIYPRRQRSVSIEMVLFSWVYVVILFEVLLPHFSDKFTADWADLVAYGLGGVLFHFSQPKGNGSHRMMIKD